MPYEKWREPYRSWGKRLADWVYSDASLMVGLGVVMICRGLSFLFIPQKHVLLHRFDIAAPTIVSVALWCVVGLLLIVAACWHKTMVGAVVFGAASLVMAGWAGLFILTDPELFLNRGLVVIFCVLLMWRSIWKSGKGAQGAVLTARKVVADGRSSLQRLG